MLTLHCRPSHQVFYHGSSSLAGIIDKLMPTTVTGVLSEQGRKKNLDRVFFTTNVGYAKVYARRACNSYGGTPKLYRVVMPIGVEKLNETLGCDVYHASFAFVEEIDFEKEK